MFRKKKAKDKETQSTFVDEHIDISADWSEEESSADKEKPEVLEELEELDSKDKKRIPRRKKRIKKRRAIPSIQAMGNI